jgi:trans-aconitate methyltransferase
MPEVNRAESTWGQKTPPYTLDMFNFAITQCNSWLDLGCGFGRFLSYLTSGIEDPDYIGYDSSDSMLERVKENFPHFSPRIFNHPITNPITNIQESIICSAVFIHITLEDQQKVLNNILKANPKRFTFDINSPAESTIIKTPHFERFVRGAEGAFRMTWQSHYEMTRKILSMFKSYSLSVKFYTINTNRIKAVYMLERA